MRSPLLQLGTTHQPRYDDEEIYGKLYEVLYMINIYLIL